MVLLESCCCCLAACHYGVEHVVRSSACTSSGVGFHSFQGMTRCGPGLAGTTSLTRSFLMILSGDGVRPSCRIDAGFEPAVMLNEVQRECLPEQ